MNHCVPDFEIDKTLAVVPVLAIGAKFCEACVLVSLNNNLDRFTIYWIQYDITESDPTSIWIIGSTGWHDRIWIFPDWIQIGLVH